MGKASRDKGKRGELELAHALKYYGYDCERGVQYCGRKGNADVVGLPGVHIESKRVERLDLYGSLSQSKSDAKDGEIPVVMHRKNNCEWVVIIPLEHFITIYREWEAGRQTMEANDG